LVLGNKYNTLGLKMSFNLNKKNANSSLLLFNEKSASVASSLQDFYVLRSQDNYIDRTDETNNKYKERISFRSSFLSSIKRK
jgi:hypothetical protein